MTDDEARRGARRGAPTTSAAALVVLGTILAAHLSLFPRIAGVDAFYHMGHARRYLTHGLFDTSFPWGTQSIIGDLGADLWWGFHVMLVPFAAVPDVAWAIRLAALVLTLVLAATVWLVLRRHEVPGAGWWSALFLVAVPNVLYRYVMVRPHVLSLALALLLASLLVRGRWWHVLLVSLAMTWIHLGVFWMAPGIVAAYALARIVVRRGPDSPGVPLLQATGAVLAGTLLGVLLRPHPLATAQLAYVQIVRLFAEKATDEPLIFAVEIRPLPAAELVRSTITFLVVWLGAVVLAVRALARRMDRSPALEEPERTLLTLSLLCALAFLAITLLSARRALVEFTAFGFLTLPLVWSFLVSRSARRRSAVAVAVLLTVHLGWTARRHMLNVALVAEPSDKLEQVAEWLTQNTRPGDVVFTTHWDDFGPLFARDQQNLYLGGMDPIFQYAHDPGRYWEHFYLSGDLIQQYTCDAFPCYSGKATDTWMAIRQHFRARWVLVEPRRNPKLSLFLLKDPRFTLALETRQEAVFKVLSPDELPRDPGS